MNTYLHLQTIPKENHELSLVQKLSPHRVKRQLKVIWQKTPLYALNLSGKGPRDIALVPMDSWPGSHSQGRKLLDGTIVLGGESVFLKELWFPEHLSKAALCDLHSFEWLRNLRTLGDNASRRMARQLILNWIDANQNWGALSWRVDIMGHRLSNWIGLYDFFCASADDIFRHKFFKSLYRQARHLSLNWQDIPSSSQRLYALHGLIHVIICLNTNLYRLPGLLEQLDKLIEQQILEDGGHKSRSPNVQLIVLRILIDLRSLLRQSNHEISPLLQKTIMKMAPIVRLFRHGDGSLSCFGPYNPLNPSLVDMVLSIADVRGRPPFSAAHMGYERCNNKTGLLLINSRPSLIRSPSHFSEKGTGIFNFEWSTARHPLVTYSDVVFQSETGRQACATETKHDHLAFNHQIYPEGSFLEAEYQNHQPSWNFSQHRKFFLSNKALDFRGEDILTSHIPCFFAIRFVFHSDIKLIRHGRQIIIECPKGQRWTLLTSSTNTQIDTLETSHTAQMLVLLGELQPNKPKKIRWAFRSEGA